MAVNKKPLSYIPIQDKPELKSRRRRESRKIREPPPKQPRAKPFSLPRFIPLPNEDGSYNISDVPGFNGTQERTWEERYNELKEFKRVRKTFNVQREALSALGIWVTVQRFLIDNRRKKKTPAISEFHFQRLELIGFTDVRYRRPWKERYKDLVAYHAAFGHTDVPEYEIGGLGMWTKNQRSKHYNVTLGTGGSSKLYDWQVKALDDLNFPWMKRGQDALWRKRYDELVAYKDKHGHTLVPRESPDGLGLWVMTQRNLYGHLHDDDVLPESRERIDLLDDLGFSWDPHEGRWMLRYKELRAYKELHGHTLVPQETHDGLGFWVRTQRQQYVYFVSGGASHMTQERRDLLNKLGFVWSPQPDGWMKHYEKLKAYKDKHGDTLVPKSNDGLGRWVAHQRVQYARFVNGKDSSITRERIELFNEIGFAWDALDEQWLQRFNELCAYKEEQRDTLVPSRSKDGLGTWVMTQRKAFREHCEGKRSMQQERIDKLNRIGFVWRIRSPPIKGSKLASKL